MLAEANGSVDQHGAVADWLEVDRRYERPVEALLGDLLQHVVVPTYQHATSGLELLRARDAGRCGFVVVGEHAVERERLPAVDGAIALDAVVQADRARTRRPCVRCCHAPMSPNRSRRPSPRRSLTGAEAATPDGDIVRGRHVVVGGSRHDARGILATKNEIRELRARVDEGRDGVAAVAASLAGARRSRQRNHRRNREAQRRAPRAGEGHRRVRGPDGAARGRGDAAGTQGRVADQRAPARRRGSRAPRRPPGRGAAVDRRARGASARAGGSIHGGAAAAFGCARARRIACRARRRGEGRACRARRAAHRTGRRSRAARRCFARDGDAPRGAGRGACAEIGSARPRSRSRRPKRWRASMPP